MNPDSSAAHCPNLVGGIAAYHLFPDFVGGKNDAVRHADIENSRKVISLAMERKGASPFIAGEPSLADFYLYLYLYLAPIVAYVVMTPDMDGLLEVEGFTDWWSRVQALASFQETPPQPG